MLKRHIADLLRENFDFTFTESQQELIGHLGGFIADIDQKQLYLIKGYAGTGKTSLVRSLVKTLDHLHLNYVLMAPTGRAAKVLSAYAERPAYTIHKKIYIQKTTRDGVGVFTLDRNLHSKTFFIIDEASMITNESAEQSLFGSGRVLEDLINYVTNDRQCKLILIGDAAQLPPVGLDVSPALDVKVLEKYGFTVHEAFLSEVLRQSADSGILRNATYLRNLLGKGQIEHPRFTVRDHDDIFPLSGGDFLEELENAYQKSGKDQVIVVTRSNKRANQFNKGIRERILWREEEIAEGDYIMVVKNNYFWLDEDQPTPFIANGDIAEILQIEGFQERYGFRFADVVLRFTDYNDLEVSCKIILDSLMIESASLGQEKNRELYMNILEDFPEIKAKRKQYLKVREHPFFNALQVKFAYAVTCHKAQGGQWDVVFLDQGYISEEMINVEYIRWLYTAFTRATRRLYLVNFHSSYFEE